MMRFTTDAIDVQSIENVLTGLMNCDKVAWLSMGSGCLTAVGTKDSNVSVKVAITGNGKVAIMLHDVFGHVFDETRFIVGSADEMAASVESSLVDTMKRFGLY